MTIDEAIAHAREVAVRNREQYKNCPSDRTDIRYQTCEECAEEHEQLAEWLEELSRRRVEEIFRKADEKAIRDKAIDDFVNACKDNILCQTLGLRQFDIEKIAEQLKAGGKNE